MESWWWPPMEGVLPKWKVYIGQVLLAAFQYPSPTALFNDKISKLSKHFVIRTKVYTPQPSEVGLTLRLASEMKQKCMRIPESRLTEEGCAHLLPSLHVAAWKEAVLAGALAPSWTMRPPQATPRGWQKGELGGPWVYDEWRHQFRPALNFLLPDSFPWKR